MVPWATIHSVLNIPYSGKFSNGANFHIIRKHASCAKIKTGLIRLAVHDCIRMPRKCFEILFLARFPIYAKICTNENFPLYVSMAEIF